MTPSTTTDLLSSPKQRKSVGLRAPWCNADNCYRALFPCPSPWIVTEAVLYCATVSANSASNYPTQAIAACGTGKERYISACSCPATNCPVGTTSLTTTSRITAPSAPAQAPAVTTTVADKDTSKSASAAIVTPSQASATTISTAVDGEAVLAQTTNDGAGGSDPKLNIEISEEPMTIDSPATKDAPLDDVSSTNSQIVAQEKSGTKSHSPVSPYSPSPLSLTMPLGQSSESTSSVPLPLLSKSASRTETMASSRASPPTITSFLMPASPNTPHEGHEELGAGIVAVIAVGATLIALLLLGAAIYCCMKRRKARRSARLRALTLSRESMPSQGFEVPSEWKPPVELPHQTAVVSRPELQDSFVFRTQPSDSASLSAPVTPSSLSAHSSFAQRDAAEMQGAPLHPSPAELFVMPAELPGVYKI